jgi:hypothetical protein
METTMRFDYRSQFFKSLIEIQSQCENENYDGEINFELIGFIKELATELADVELQELTVNLEGLCEQLFGNTIDLQEDILIETSPLKVEQLYSPPYKVYAPEIISKFHSLFYNDKEYQVDMSSYRKQIEDNRVALKQVGLYDHCARYVADAKAFSKLYHRVKDKLYDLREMPTKEEFDRLVDESLDRIHVLANEFVVKNLNKAINAA